MAPDEPTRSTAAGEQSDEDAPQGVFGNLPQTRPGSRSPRRDQGSQSKAARVSEAPGERPAPEADTPQETPPPPPSTEGGGLEDVAWAGVAAAAEAATIGVRLATRAIEAMRDAVDRR